MYCVWWNGPSFSVVWSSPRVCGLWLSGALTVRCPILGDWLAGGPNSVSVDWMAQQCGLLALGDHSQGRLGGRGCTHDSRMGGDGR